jgi:HlyD family secretion protein
MRLRLSGHRRWIAWGVGGAFVVALVALMLAPEAVPVDLSRVTRAALQVTLDHEGKTQVHDRFMISAPVDGRVLRIELRPGDPVEAGRTALAAFAPAAPVPLDARSRAEARARVAAARATYSRARAARDEAEAEARLARSELERRRRLAEQGIVARSDLDAAEADAGARDAALEAAEAAANAARHDLEAAQASLLEPRAGARAGGVVLTLRSPVSGVVLRRLRESEAVVPTGEPLIEVADTSYLEIVSDYLSTDAVKMRPGMRVLVVRWGGDAPLPGRVRRVEPSGFLKISALGVEEQRVNVVIDFDDREAASRLLGDGYRVETEVVTWEGESVLQVPTSALFRKGDDWAVFRFDGGRARLTTVRIGHRSDLAAEVEGGLREGQQVVEHPSEDVSDGARVTPRRS